MKKKAPLVRAAHSSQPFLVTMHRWKFSVLAAAAMGLAGFYTEDAAALALGGLALVRWHGTTSAERPLLGATLVAPLLVVVASLVGLNRLREPRTRTDPAGPESPDQDDRWKLGAFYYAPDDPRFMVEKRMGLGTTVNFGHPGGKVFAAIVIGLVSVAIVLPLLPH